MRVIKWTFGLIVAAAIVLGFTWLALDTFEPLTSFLLQFLYGEANVMILAIKVMWIGVIIVSIALLLYSAVRAVFNHSR